MIYMKELFNILSVVYLFISERSLAYKTDCSGGYCFVVSDYTNGDKFLTQSNAVQWCLSNNSQLVEIVNSDIQNSVVNLIWNSNGGGSYNYFTNGKRAPGSWIRLNGASISSITVNGQSDVSYAYGYLTWKNSQFDIYASRPYDNKEGYICSGVGSDCTNGVTINGQCYKAYTGSIAWYDARDNCLSGGGDLASFDSITTNAGFSVLNGTWLNTQYKYWIGFKRENWTWQGSNQDVRYSDWLINQPTNNYNCLCLATRQWPFQWTECDCNQISPFVCFSTIQSSASRSTSTTSLPPSSSNTRPTPNSHTTVSNVGSTSTSSTISESNAPSTATTLFTNRPNTGLSDGAKIGIGVGVGVGVPLIIAAIVVVVIFMRKRSPMKGERNLQTPDLITTRGSAAVHPDKESQTYATVVGHNDNTYKSAMTINQPTEYAELEILSNSTLPDSEYSNSPPQPKQTEPYLDESM